MQREFEKPQRVWIRGTIALLTGIWVWEFLPLMQDLHLLMAAPTFIAILVVLAVLQVIPLLSLRLMGGLLAGLGYIWYYFAPANVAPGIGFSLVMSALWHDVAVLGTSHSLLDPLQTLLFILALCGIYWLVVYAASRKRLWLFYNGLAVLVLGLVDGNTPIHPTQALLVDIVIFLFVLGLNHYHNLGASAVFRRKSSAVRFFVPLTGVIALSFFAAELLPKQPAVWANPFQNHGQGGAGGSGGSQLVIGYQSNNSHLGGSFVMNYTPVLSVITKYPAYLRGQSYSTYTGKGWIQTPGNTSLVPPNQPFDLSSSAAFQNLPSQQVSQQVTVVSNNLRVPILFGAYSLSKLTSNLKGNRQGVQVDHSNGTVYTLANLSQNETYSVVSRELEDPSAILSKVKAMAQYPADIRSMYLQLPASLPGDVRALTDKVTAGSTTEYQKVTSVLNYLQGNYSYSTQGIPVPGPGQDYVAQFLFQTQKGYCNNFSSAMAVMLRTVNIPTRWVTGFTYGQQDYQYTGPEQKFVVTEADAHSWVEVYFPGVGWVPFDPTPNFTMTFAPTPANTQNPPTTPNTPTQPPHKTPPVKQPLPVSGGGSTDWLATALSVTKWAAGILLLAGLITVIATRRRLRAARLWAGMTPYAMSRAVRHLLKTIAKVQGLPNPAPTLRELGPVAREHGIHEQDYREFVSTAERAWYGGEAVPGEHLEHARRTWVGWMTRLYQQRKMSRRRRRK